MSPTILGTLPRSHRVLATSLWHRLLAVPAAKEGGDVAGLIATDRAIDEAVVGAFPRQRFSEAIVSEIAPALCEHVATPCNSGRWLVLSIGPATVLVRWLPESNTIDATDIRYGHIEAFDEQSCSSEPLLTADLTALRECAKFGPDEQEAIVAKINAPNGAHFVVYRPIMLGGGFHTVVRRALGCERVDGHEFVSVYSVAAGERVRRFHLADKMLESVMLRAQCYAHDRVAVEFGREWISKGGMS